MLNLTRLNLGIDHESEFQGLGITSSPPPNPLENSAHRDEPPRGYLATAKTFIEAQLKEAERTQPLHRVGFLILSHGAVSNWIMLDWWSSHILFTGFSAAKACRSVPGIE